MASFLNGAPAPANGLHAASNGAASGSLTSPFAAAPNQPLATELSKEMRASLGTQSHRHTRCIRCWEFRWPNHPNWQHCGSVCPRCPDNDQHWSRACPRLLDETNDEWWIAHAGCHKPEWRFLNAKAFRAPLPRAAQPFAAGENGNRRSVNGIKINGRTIKIDGPHHGRTIKFDGGAIKIEGRTNNRILPAPLRGGDNTYRPGRARSRSPERERVVEYRARDGALSAWRPERGSLLTGDHCALAPQAQAQMGQAVGSGTEGLGVQQPSGSAGSSGSGSSGATPRPTAIIWSDGSTTKPCIRDLIMHDAWMTMVVHQTVLLADFFDRHPDVTKGESVVSEGMRGYLADIRRDCPSYLSPAPPGNGYEEPFKGDDDATILNSDPEAGRQ